MLEVRSPLLQTGYSQILTMFGQHDAQYYLQRAESGGRYTLLPTASITADLLQRQMQIYITSCLQVQNRSPAMKEIETLRHMLPASQELQLLAQKHRQRHN